VTTRTIVAAAAVIATLSSSRAVPVGGASPAGEWRAYAADKAGSRYSPLDRINRATVKNLRIAWRQSILPAELRDGLSDPKVPTVSQNTPLMASGLLYVSTARGIVAALDPESGNLVWQDRPPARGADAPGRALRGVAYWSDGRDERILAITGRYLVALNAKTGKRYSDFGDAGSGDVDLTKGYDHQAPGYRWGGPPLVVGDIVVIGGLGGAPGENTGRQRGNQGDIRAYSIRTGKQLWKFRTIPRPGEFGNESWLNDSWSYSGDVSIWGQMSADEELGYVYADRAAQQQLLRRRASR